MNNGEMPIFELNMAMVPLKMNLKYPIKEINPSPGVMSFAVVTCRISLTNIKIEDLHCDASICNGSMLVQSDGSVNPTKCACYSKRGQTTELAVVFDASFEPIGNGNEFHIEKCVDVLAQRHYFLTPGGCRSLKASQLNNSWGVKIALEECYESNIDHVNDNGGWDVVLWHKQGLVADAVENNQNPGYGQEQQMIANSQLKLHLVRIVPHTPEEVSQVVMDTNKINLPELFQQQQMALQNAN